MGRIIGLAAPTTKEAPKQETAQAVPATPKKAEPKKSKGKE